MLTYNKETLKAQVKAVLDYSNEMDCKVDKLLDTWENNKRELIDMFGGKLIIESDKMISMEMTQEDRLARFNSFMDDMGILYLVNSTKLNEFLLLQGCDAFYANRVEHEWSTRTLTIKKGMKISRALKYFGASQNTIHHLQTQYSQIIQEIKIKGKLCLSIHPLDYLSISENAHNWRSCHSLNGEFRAGNLSYMSDKVTIVAYLKSGNEDVLLPNFPTNIPWNSKKWRVLFYLSPDRDLMYNSRPYPYNNDIMVKKCYKKFETIIGGEWPNEPRISSTDAEFNHIKDKEGTMHFNDCITSSDYTPMFKCIYGNDNIEKTKPIEVGEEVYCLKCEQEIADFSAAYECINCGDYQTCAGCGTYIFDYEGENQMLDGHMYCEDCYENDVVWCNGCGEKHHCDNPELVYIDPTDRSEVYCKECFDNLLIEEEEDENV